MTPTDGHDELRAVLRDTADFLERFVEYPSGAARTTHALWIAHTYAMPRWDSTPRLAFRSDHPACGKTRAFEVTASLVPNPLHVVGSSAAYLIRRMSESEEHLTVLYDEIDSVLGSGGKNQQTLLSMMDAGHRRGPTAGLCVSSGEEFVTTSIPIFNAVAFAGRGTLPLSLRSRCVEITLVQADARCPIEPWRIGVSTLEAELLATRLRVASSAVLAYSGPPPEMPEGMVGRTADVWEPLLTVAMVAGGSWPDRARKAAIALSSLERT